MRRLCKRPVSPALALAALVLILFGRAMGDSLNLRLAGEWPFSGLTSVIGVASRNLAFVGSGGGVYVLDISHPDTPQVLSMKIQTLGTVNDLFYESGTQRLYVAGQQGGLSIWDLTTATNPQRLGVCRTPSQAYRVVVSGGYAYIADRDSGLRIINVLTPTNPYQVGRCDTSGDAQAIAVSGSYAYVGDSNCLRVINVSDPANPYQTGVCDSILTFGIAQADSFIYVASGYALIVVNVADPAHPFRMGSCPPMSNAVDVALRSHYAYVPDDMFGWLVIDVSDPWNPHQTGAMGGGGKSWVTVSDTLAFFIGDDVDICNAADSSYPREVGSYSPVGLSGSCAVSGQYAYLGSSQGLLVFDISDLQNISEVGSCPAAGAGDIAIRGQYAYVCTGYGLDVLDVSNPQNPQLRGYCGIHDVPVRIAVSGSLACIAAQNSVALVDITDPTQPTLVGAYDSLVPATGIVVRDSYAYVSETWEGLRILDITDPARPTLVGDFRTVFYAYGLALIWPYAYIATWDSGMSIIDVSNPRNPVWAGQYAPDTSIACIATQGRYVYVMGYGAPLQILDASDPTAPVAVAWYDDAGLNPVPVGAHVFAGSSGLHVYEQIAYGIEESKVRNVPDYGPRLLSCRLSGGSLGIGFALPKETSVGFRLYDLAGREMAQLPSVRYDRGKHIAVLAVGHLSNGVYFIKSSPPMPGAGKAVVCK